ncbi:MAG: retroviral-like aspartic protease family protein, partial [Dehalococcoidia bacterium]|nr:retroviral-like aspartic protease family protein [Dehalococcoidia bacterium]
TIGGEVGTFSVDFIIRNRNDGRERSLAGLVDTGASYTVIPAEILDELGIARDEVELFSLADGSVQELAIGWADMELERRTRPVYVVFSTSPDKILLGAMALEAFALAADAKNHRLIRAELTL